MILNILELRSPVNYLLEIVLTDYLKCHLIFGSEQIYVCASESSVFCALICSIYSGTVAGAREAFLYGIPSIAMSYDWYANIFFFDFVCCSKTTFFHIQQLLVTKRK